ncbi:MAG: hypothetical protein WBQ69_02790 [Gallionella sp.]
MEYQKPENVGLHQIEKACSKQALLNYANNDQATPATFLLPYGQFNALINP